MKKTLLINLVLYMLLLYACVTDKDKPAIEPKFYTEEVTTPTYNYTSVYAEIDQEQQSSIIDLIEDHGFVWSKTSNNSLDNSASEIISLGVKRTGYAFAGSLRDLKGNTTYYIRAYIKMNDQVYYANEISFTTKPGNWRKLKDFPGTNTLHPASFILNDNVFVVCKNEVWSYDPATDTWAHKNSFPVETVGGTGFTINGIGYLYCDNIWKYDQSTDNWALQLPGSDISYLHKGCEGVTSFVYDGKAYIAGGKGNLNEPILVYDPSINDQYSLGFNHQALNVSYASSLAENGKAYIVGGQTYSQSMESQVLYYNLAIKSWSRKQVFRSDKNFETERAEMVSFNINGALYFGMGFGNFPAGGGPGYDSREDLYRYDIETDSWETQTFPISIGEDWSIQHRDRAGGIGFSVGNKGYIGLGESRRYNSTTSQYESKPLHDLWEFSPN